MSNLLVSLHYAADFRVVSQFDEMIISPIHLY
jgi:hypothetical protein